MKIVERDVDGVRVLDLHGACTIGDADWLRDTCLRVFACGHRLVLNLTDVTELDHAAVGEIRSIDRRIERSGTQHLGVMMPPAPKWPTAVTIALQRAVTTPIVCEEDAAIKNSRCDGAGTYA